MIFQLLLFYAIFFDFTFILYGRERFRSFEGKYLYFTVFLQYNGRNAKGGITHLIQLPSGFTTGIIAPIGK